MSSSELSKSLAKKMEDVGTHSASGFIPYSGKFSRGQNFAVFCTKYEPANLNTWTFGNFYPVHFVC